MHWYTCSSYFSSHKVVVILIEKQFSSIFLKIKNTKNYFVSGTAKIAHKAMYLSFVQKENTRCIGRSVFSISDLL
jgi:ssDNA-specific exonuclease RecJ